ncbi:hypothetical protein I3760_11G158000 [Carya illinoinensis]|nr:hypothetical protein I3760_11G158000 [Carya illinoinensis]
MLSGTCGLRACCLRLSFSPEKPLIRADSFRLTRRRRVFSVACPVSSAKKEKVIVISGPTGAGKSRLALELAKRLNGEIISADSVQVYQGLDVGSAKPTPSDRKEVPHHLVDILHPSEEYSVGQFFEDARQATRCILDSGRVPIVSGGTGLYLRWFMYGKPDVPKASPEIASEVCSELADLQRNEDWDAAVQLVVKAGDPKAQFLAANDWYRLRRSLEIIKEVTGFCLRPAGFLIQVFYPIQILQLEQSVTDKQWSTYYTVGSKEVGVLLEIFLPFYLASRKHLATVNLLCRNFAKRQLTWFRNEQMYHWLDASKPLEQVMNFIYDGYHEKGGALVVPESLRMKKDISNRRETSELKAYRTRNRHFVSRQDCSHILDWIRRTQPTGEAMSA